MRRGIRIAQWVVMLVALLALIGNLVLGWGLSWVTTAALVAALLVVFSNSLMRQKPRAEDERTEDGGTVPR